MKLLHSTTPYTCSVVWHKFSIITQYNAPVGRIL